MTDPCHVAVIDIGKTNAKVVLVDLAALNEIGLATMANRVLPGPPYPHFDTEALAAFVTGGLARLHREHRVDAISITTHGASAALLAADGTLAAPVLDYEHEYPAGLRAEYDALRPPFDETGSPRLPMGLNLGAQLHWLLATQPGLSDRIAHVVTWPQYWAHRLTGVLATDVTSLGCHTDLWNASKGTFSTLVGRLGLSGRLPVPRRPGEVLGPVLPEIARQTGLAPATPVACGIHDSNASLLPHLIGRTGAFSVVSTGTWVIVMTLNGRPVTLDPARDTLINVNALGQPVPSARFMGGREYEVMRPDQPVRPAPQDVRRVLDGGVMLLPSVQTGSGPFPDRKMGWRPALPPDPAAVEVAVGFYLALMTAECLAMTGAAGPAIVEGPFGQNALFLDMLASATARPVLASQSRTGTATGAALLFAPGGAGPEGGMDEHLPREGWSAYARLWRERADAAG